MTKQTTLRTEIEELANRLVRAGLPPAQVGAEFMAIGGGLFTQENGAKAAVKFFISLAATLAENDNELDAAPAVLSTKH